jgi:hypothetical protein
VTLEAFQSLEVKKFNLIYFSDFYIWFPVCNQNQTRMVKDLYFMMSYLVYSQNWLNLPRVLLQLPMHYIPLLLRTKVP